MLNKMIEVKNLTKSYKYKGKKLMFLKTLISELKQVSLLHS